MTVREALESKIEELEEEILIQKTAAEEVASELFAANNEAAKAKEQATKFEEALVEAKNIFAKTELSYSAEVASLKAELEDARKKAAEIDPATLQEIESLKKELAVIKEQKNNIEERLAEAEQTSLSSSVLLDKPEAFSVTEKFPGEIREHLLAALTEAMRTADQSGKERRAKILEAILYMNPASDELVSRRDQVRDIMKSAGATIGESAIAELEKMGFRFISGNKHNKLDWGGVRVIIPKTPSDHRAFLNAAIDIANRVF